MDCLSIVVLFFIFFFFKQKTAYEMRISDWSSDVCSSDLAAAIHALLVDELIDGMMQRLGVDEDADVELRGAEIEAGAVLEPQRVDVARLVARDAGGIGPVRRGQRLCVGKRAGQVLIDAVVACVKARRDPVGGPTPHIAVEAPAERKG